LAPRLRKEYSYISNPLWAFVAYSRVNFTFTFTFVSLTGRWVVTLNRVLAKRTEYPAGALPNVQTTPGAYSASYSMGNEGSCSEG